MVKTKEITTRLMRLTWNKFNWEKPQGHKWTKANQQKKNIAYEKQYGFGHEEWFLNPEFSHEGYQYGYIRGVEGMPYEDLFIDKIVLFTIHEETKIRYLVGELNSVEIIEEPKKVKRIFKKEFNSILNQLENVGADYEEFKKDGFWFNVRFKLENTFIYPELIYSPFINNNKSKFKRFQPFKISSFEQDKLQLDSINHPTLTFKSGETIFKQKFIKVREESVSNVNRLHSVITKDLYSYHNSVLEIEEKFLSAEKTTLGPRILDFVIEKNSQYSIFEVKTNLSGMLNFRLALGQLFEYAFLDSNIKLEKLIIVGPAKLNDLEKKYLSDIRKIVSISLEYWAYQKSENDLEKRFLIY